MAEERVLIKRYPNRRFYARETSNYVSIQEIEELIRKGRTVEIRDSQSGEDLTRAVLTQIIIERHPEKMALFPTAMLHFILRANDMMASFLRGYFRDSLTYLEYLQRHGNGVSLTEPLHWMQAWLRGWTPPDGRRVEAQPPSPAADTPALMQRVAELEQRIQQLEASARETSQKKEKPGS